MVVLEQSDVFVRHFLSIHLLHPVGKDTAVQSDEVLLWKLSDEGRQVLLVDVGVCIVLAAGSCVLGLAVLDEEVEVVADLTVFHVPLSVKHISLCYCKVLFCHEAYFDLVLDFLHMHALGDAYMGKDVYEVLLCSEASY